MTIIPLDTVIKMRESHRLYVCFRPPSRHLGQNEGCCLMSLVGQFVCLWLDIPSSRHRDQNEEILSHQGLVWVTKLTVVEGKRWAVGRWAGRRISRGLRWDRFVVGIPLCCINSLINPLLEAIFPKRFEPSWWSRSLIMGRQAYSCKSLILI